MWVKQIDLSTVVRSCTHTCIKKIKSTIRFKMLKFFKSCYVFYLLSVYTQYTTSICTCIFFQLLTIYHIHFFLHFKEEGHLSYQCPKNLLGEREPPPKKERKRKKQDEEGYGYEFLCFLSIACYSLKLWPFTNMDEIKCLRIICKTRVPHKGQVHMPAGLLNLGLTSVSVICSFKWFLNLFSLKPCSFNKGRILVKYVEIDTDQ